MTTNAESAQEWFNKTNPDQQQLTTVLSKLEERINDHSNADNDLTGTIEALDLLQRLYIDKFETPLHEENTETQRQNIDYDLDTTPLGDKPDIKMEHLTEAERRERFEKLKNQLNIK